MAGAFALVLAGCGGTGHSVARGQRAANSPLDHFDPAQQSAASAGFQRGAADQPTAAATAEAAVRAYLDAQVRGDQSAAFRLLSNDDRAAYGPESRWLLSAATLPRFTSYTVTSGGAPQGDAVSVSADVTITPRLDEVVGLVPGRAAATYVAVNEDGGWRISLERSSLEPTYPADSGAADAATIFVTDEIACRPPTNVYTGNLIGRPAAAKALCGQSAAVQVAAKADRLAQLKDMTPFLSAFGAEVGDWARVVHVTQPSPLDVVTAPFGDSWVVIGVTSP